MAEARRLWHAVGRPNVCIKIPDTPAGVPAIEAMLYEGININWDVWLSERGLLPPQWSLHCRTDAAVAS